MLQTTILLRMSEDTLHTSWYVMCVHPSTDRPRLALLNVKNGLVLLILLNDGGFQASIVIFGWAAFGKLSNINLPEYRSVSRRNAFT